MVEKSTFFPRTFFDVISMVEKSTLFRRTFIGVISVVEKSTLFPHIFFNVISMVEKSTFFPCTFWCSFNGRKIHVVSTYFSSCNLSGRNIHIVSTYFFEVILIGKNSTSFLVSCKLIKTFEEAFRVCVTLDSWLLQHCSLYFSSKSPCCSSVPLKFESCNLHHCKKNCQKLVFLVFTKQLLYQIIFGRLHCYQVTLVKKCNKPLLQKSETKVFNQKRFIKNLLKVSEKNNSGVSIINQIMSKLLTLTKRLQFWTGRVFWHFTFHILQTNWGILW